ncbi:glycosyltransferase family 1 protein [Rubrobacter taiwanensis]|jgi:phosphatidylinositol alpha-mannosyltransferase|uniref:Glycosyltransferase family 1 protein n=1 Tax=Rubrobacter taiwanensis TaxID=185139 RepID=A0A4R1BL41_9ACTN|nr:glycosyltransferase family 4 protein [Rubrobacter taiwanensis]TCJ18069.1 glycosyltransferase family 1 protein [Rubrobacter taiwanensis]
MRICIVSPYSWAFPGGVVEHVDALAQHLERRGHVVRVIAPNDPLDLRTRVLHPRLGRHGALPSRVIPVGRSIPIPSNGSLGNLAFSPRTLWRVKRTIKRIRPEVVHLHEPLLPPICWLASWAVQEMGIPIAGTFHAHYPGGCYHYRLFKPLLEPLVEALDARIAVSPAAAATAGEHFPGEYAIIPNGVDVDRFRNGETGRDPYRVLFVGRPDERKGLPILLRAFYGVVRRVPQARLVVVGSRPEDVKVPKGLLSSVEVRGMVDDAGLVRSMRTAGVLCAPSTGGESFGLVLIEAMAAGLPVVASDIPGYDAVVTSGEDGLLVPPGEPAALADALVRVLKDRRLREKLSRAGERTARRYAWPRVAAEIERVYLRILG